MIKLTAFQPHFISPEIPELWEKYLDLRYTILRQPWGQTRQSTTDDGESRSLHLMIVDDNDEAIAAGRLEFIELGKAKIRSMAIRSDQQGKGWGRIVVRKLEAAALELNIHEIILDAREPAVGFYQKLGYADLGPSYLLFGQIPHRKMGKRMSPDQ